MSLWTAVDYCLISVAKCISSSLKSVGKSAVASEQLKESPRIKLTVTDVTIF